MECKISNKKKIVELGNFKMESGIARVSDPCYDLDTWCAGDVKNCKKGKWDALMVVQDEGQWGNRVAFLYAYHSSCPYSSVVRSHWERTNIDVGVDSGQCFIGDKKYFKDDSVVKNVERINKDRAICEDEPWYSICCDRTCGVVNGGVIPFGCVTSSGYGDGSYTCRTLSKGKKVVAIMIDYGL